MDANIPELPDSLSREFRDFCRQCLNRDPDARLPAEVLLGHPWLLMHGATSPEAATDTVLAWIRYLGGGTGK